MCFIVKHTRFLGKICPSYQQFCIASAFFRKNICCIKYIYYICDVFYSETQQDNNNNYNYIKKKD